MHTHASETVRQTDGLSDCLYEIWSLLSQHGD